MFTDFELFRMFNVDCDPKGEANNKSRSFDELYCFNDIKLPLWGFHAKKLSKRVKFREDHIKPGITSEPPGKTRVADLAKFYTANETSEISPFSIPGIDL